MNDWEQSRQAVISKCPYYIEIKPQINKVKSLSIPPLLKLFVNEAISDFVFGMYTSTFILCRTACEIALKYYVIESYIRKTPKDINKSVIDRILDSNLDNLILILEYNNIATGKIKATIGEVKKFGNIHVHGKIDKMIEKYLDHKLTKKSLVDYCLNLKKLDYLMSPEGLMKTMMFDGEISGELDQIKISKKETKAILEQFPEVLRDSKVMPIAKKILLSTLSLYEEIFGKLLVEKKT